MSGRGWSSTVVEFAFGLPGSQPVLVCYPRGVLQAKPGVGSSPGPCHHHRAMQHGGSTHTEPWPAPSCHAGVLPEAGST